MATNIDEIESPAKEIVDESPVSDTNNNDFDDLDENDEYDDEEEPNDEELLAEEGADI